MTDVSSLSVEAALIAEMEVHGVCDSSQPLPTCRQNWPDDPRSWCLGCLLASAVRALQAQQEAMTQPAPETGVPLPSEPLGRRIRSVASDVLFYAERLGGRSRTPWEDGVLSQFKASGEVLALADAEILKLRADLSASQEALKQAQALIKRWEKSHEGEYADYHGFWHAAMTECARQLAAALSGETREETT